MSTAFDHAQALYDAAEPDDDWGETSTTEETTMKRIETALGDYIVYHVSEAGDPAAHDTDNGEWFYQPADDTSGDVYSDGWPTEEMAHAEALDWVAMQVDERNENAER